MNILLKNPFFCRILFLIGVGFTLFFQLGVRGLNEPDEGRYAEMGREMLVTGDWLVPRLNGVPHYAKPPFTYWCVAGSLKLFGLHEWGARFPAAAAALITAWVIYLFGKKLENEVAGLCSSLVLVTMGLFFIAGRLITPDMILTACISISIYGFWSWWMGDRSRSGWLWLMYTALGIGFLTKGPMVLLLVFLPIVAFMVAERKFSEVRRLRLIPGLLWVLVIAMPWFLWMCQLNPELYDFYLVGEIKERFTSGRGRSKFTGFHLVWFVLADCFPWNALLFYALWRHLKKWREKVSGSGGSFFLLLWFFLPFVFFNILSSKLITYLLPVMPPLALMIGVWLARWMKDEEPFPATIRWVTLMIMPIPYFAFQGLPDFFSSLLVAEKVQLGLRLSAYAILSGTGVAILMGFWANRFNKALLAVTLWLMGVATLHYMVYQAPSIEPKLKANSSWKVLTRSLDDLPLVGVPIRMELHPDGTKLKFQRSGPRVVMYEFFNRSCSFYLMGKMAEVVPLYGGNSIYERESDSQKEAKLERDDLVALLKEGEKVYGFTRREHLKDLRTLTGLELPILNQVGDEDRSVVLFSN